MPKWWFANNPILPSHLPHLVLAERYQPSDGFAAVPLHNIKKH